MTTYVAQMDRKWPEVDQKWARSGMEVSICPSVRLSIPNTYLTSLTNLMPGIYKRRALAPCDFFLWEEWPNMSLVTVWMTLTTNIKPSSPVGVSSGRVFTVGLMIIKKPGFRCPEASSITTISLRRVNHTDFFESFSASKALSKELVKGPFIKNEWLNFHESFTY